MSIKHWYVSVSVAFIRRYSVVNEWFFIMFQDNLQTKMESCSLHQLPASKKCIQRNSLV